MSTAESRFFDQLMSAEKVVPTAPTSAAAMPKTPESVEKDNVPLTIRNLFTHYDLHPVVLDLALLKLFGVEWFGWEIQTILQEIEREFVIGAVSERTRGKIQVVKTLHISPQPWENWQVFEKIVQGLNGNVPRWDVVQAPSLAELFAGVDILKALREEEFGDEVRLYMAACVLNEDVFFVPPPLDFIQAEVSQPYYRCKDCHSEDSALFHDGLCDTCTRKFDPEHGLSMRPDQAALSAGKGRNVELLLRYSPDAAQTLWDQVEHLPESKIHLGDGPADFQVGKLLTARDYMNLRRKQLQEQLVALKSWLGAA